MPKSTKRGFNVKIQINAGNQQIKEDIQPADTIILSQGGKSFTMPAGLIFHIMRTWPAGPVSAACPVANWLRMAITDNGAGGKEIKYGEAKP